MIFTYSIEAIMERKTKLILILGLLSATALLPCRTIASTADFPNYFTMGVNDTVKVSPSVLGAQMTVPVLAHFEEMVYRWDINPSFPSGLSPVSAERCSDMDVHYLDSQGEEQVYQAVLTHSSGWETIASTITAQSYIDPYGSGSYLPYGFASWDIGDYEMFNITFSVEGSFRQGVLQLDGSLSIKTPYGGYGNSRFFYTEVTVIVEYEPGDVNGDGVVNITDVTQLISAALTDDYSVIDIDNADLNGDGEVNITDVTLLINLIMSE